MSDVARAHEAELARLIRASGVRRCSRVADMPGAFNVRVQCNRVAGHTGDCDPTDGVRP